MKFISKISPVLAIVLAATSALQAQSVVTEPVGFITIPAKGAGANPSATTFIALSMTRPAVYQSVIPTAATNGGVTELTFPANTFTAGQFGPASGAFYLEILNGASAGVSSPITASTTNVITLRDNITAGITNGTTTFRIRPNWTFATAFGAANETGFQPGAGSSTNADLIQLVDPLTGLATSYFYNSTSSRWEKTDNSDATNVAISPEVGLQVVRKGTSDLNFKLTGAIKTGPTGLYVNSSNTGNTINLLANPYPLETVLLKDAGLYTGNDNTGVVGGSSANAVSTSGADVVRIYDFAHNQFNDYYYDLGNALAVPPITAKWKTGTSDASSTIIPAGASISVIRKLNRAPFFWTTPQPGMVLGDTPLVFSVVSAASRKTHLNVGDIDINIPFSGTVAVESRNPGVGNTHSLVFNFTNPPLSGTAAITAGVGQVGTPVFSGKTMTVPLSGVDNYQILNLQLSNIADATGQNIASISTSLKIIAGDASNSSQTNGSDVTIARAVLATGGVVTLGNFRTDFNNSGAINGSDVTIARARAGLPLQ